MGSCGMCVLPWRLQRWYRVLSDGSVAVGLYNKAGAVQPPIPGPPCTAWNHTVGGYYEACGGCGAVCGAVPCAALVPCEPPALQAARVGYSCVCACVFGWVVAVGARARAGADAPAPTPDVAFTPVPAVMLVRPGLPATWASSVA
jgi:hypothetical protein